MFSSPTSSKKIKCSSSSLHYTKYSLTILLTRLSCTATTYAGTFDKVVTIFNNSCAFSACHDTENPVAGLDLAAQILKQN